MEKKLEKNEVRAHFKMVRKNICHSRRKIALGATIESIVPMVNQCKYVLSYASFKDELSTIEVNDFLEKEGKLLLPKIHNNSLRVFHITNIKSQLEISRWGVLEPIEKFSKEIQYDEIDLAIVPGLAFDIYNHRIGYGKGFYDRVLSLLSPEVISCGIGFKEQIFKKQLPLECHDKALSQVILF